MADHPSNIPPGWGYNPASWSQRLPIVGLAVIGFGIAMYLSLYQWEVFHRVWEPFFGDDSRKILRESWVSKLLPFPDAFLGALGYFADAVAGVIGGRSRWRTMPWVVVLFGLLVGPLGFVSIMLVVFQPVLFNAWCTLCLSAAVVSVLMIGPAMDEFLASMQYLRRVHVAGGSVNRAFWGLETPPQSPRQEAMVPQARGRQHPGAKKLAMVAQAMAGCVGIWLMTAPAVLGYNETAAEASDRIVGPVIATFAIIAVWEVTRPLRWINVPLAAWLLIAPWILGFDTIATVNSTASGLAVILLSLPGFMNRHRYGGGWRLIWKAQAPAPQPAG